MQHNRRKCKKPNGKPKRPLSAYNLFFKSEREKLIRANRRLSFSNMAKEISVKWKAVDTEGRQVFVAAAEIEQISYRSAVSKWKAQIEHQLQMNHTSQPSQFGGATPLASLLAQTDPQLLQQLMMQQRMIDQQQQQQQQMIQAHMQHAALMAGPRRMSMPLVSSSTATILQPQFYEEPLQPNHATMGRRFSVPHMPVNSVQRKEVCVSVDYTPSSNDSLSSDDDSRTLNDDTTHFLINMAIIDIEEPEKEISEIPSSVVLPVTRRRSSMPMMLHKKLDDEWDVQPIAPASRRLSMQGSVDEWKSMQDLFDVLLEDENPSVTSENPLFEDENPVFHL